MGAGDKHAREDTHAITRRRAHERARAHAHSSSYSHPTFLIVRFLADGPFGDIICPGQRSQRWERGAESWILSADGAGSALLAVVRIGAGIDAGRLRRLSPIGGAIPPFVENGQSLGTICAFVFLDASVEGCKMRSWM